MHPAATERYDQPTPLAPSPPSHQHLTYLITKHRPKRLFNLDPPIPSRNQSPKVLPTVLIPHLQRPFRRARRHPPLIHVIHLRRQLRHHALQPPQPLQQLRLPLMRRAPSWRALSIRQAAGDGVVALEAVFGAHVAGGAPVAADFAPAAGDAAPYMLRVHFRCGQERRFCTVGRRVGKRVGRGRVGVGARGWVLADEAVSVGVGGRSKRGRSLGHGGRSSGEQRW